MEKLQGSHATEWVDELKQWLKTSKVIQQVEKLPGDASSRKYYRIKTSEKSYILMRTEPFQDVGLQLPFLVMQRHLKQVGVDVPEVFDVDPSKGYVLLEDLSDETLLRRLQGVSSGDLERHLYEKVIDSLVHLHYFASPLQCPANLEAFQLSFDVAKLMWEVDFTIEHFYLGHLKREFVANDLTTLKEKMGSICQELAAEPTVLTHRDFHSRNVMLTAGPSSRERLVMIDFQDARMGPMQYDLASLLKDSYYQLEQDQIERLMDYYIVRYEAVSKARLDRNHFRRIFDLMGVQRNFKAIGSFASFQNRRGDPTYLKYIGNTFENIRRTLLKYPEFSDLREILFHYYYF